MASRQFFSSGSGSWLKDSLGLDGAAPLSASVIRIRTSRIVQDRWRKAHKEPEDQSDTEAWAKYDSAHKEALKGWIQDYPDDTSLQRYDWFSAIYDEAKLSESDGSTALDHF